MECSHDKKPQRPRFSVVYRHAEGSFGARQSPVGSASLGITFSPTGPAL